MQPSQASRPKRAAYGQRDCRIRLGSCSSTSAEPPSPQAWDESVAAVQRDRAEFQRLVEDASVELTAIVPHGTKQTYLREVLLAADHNAYHVGQLMVVRRLV